MAQSPRTVSVVIPTYQEADNIVALVKSILLHLPADWDPQVLVVDDNSPDGTYQRVCEAFKDDSRVEAVLRTHDRGLARSILDGLKRARGGRIVLMDADFTHDPSYLPRMCHLSEISDVVVGSRFSAGGGMDDFPHYLASLIYNWFIRIVLQTQIQDNLSGFLVLDRQMLSKLPLEEICQGYGDYCFRLLFHALRRQYTVLELPIHYRSRQKGTSKSVFWKLLFSYTRAVIQLRWAYRSRRPEVSESSARD